MTLVVEQLGGTGTNDPWVTLSSSLASVLMALVDS
jgi:hypothetical protein